MIGNPDRDGLFVPQADDFRYVFSGATPALATVEPGRRVRVFTEDCFGGRVRGSADLPSQVCDLTQVNPISGPFHVAGARPGDTLAVHLHAITPARSWGVSATFPHFGALTGSHQTAMLQRPLPERVWRYDIYATSSKVTTQTSSGVTLTLPLTPMLGTIGLAPAARQAITTLTCGTHGGNLDTPEIAPGVTVFLGVNVEGALFGIGDGHARQGDGELCGVGVEAAMYTDLTVSVLKGVTTRWPRLVSDSQLMCIGAARPLEDAYRIAHVELVRWVGSLTGLDDLDALQLVSQAATASIGNVCDPAYSIVAKHHRDLLPAACQPDPYLSVHEQLRHSA